MEWRHSGSPRSKKNPSAKIRSKISRLDFLGSRRHPPHWLSSKGPKYQHGVLLFCWCNRRIFWRKNVARRSTRSLVLARPSPASPGTCNPQKMAYLGFQCLDHPPYSPGLAPSDYHLFPGLKKKNNWNFAIFRPTRRPLLPRRPGWTDKLLIFFSGLQKLEQRAKKCIELRGECAQ